MDYNLQATEDFTLNTLRAELTGIYNHKKKLHVWVLQTVASMILITYHSNFVGKSCNICRKSWGAGAQGLSGYQARWRVVDSRGPALVAGLSLNK
jgi:hypothetical protein